MAKFLNQTRAPAVLYLPSMVPRWDHVVLPPGEIITTDLEEDVLYLRSLTVGRELRGSAIKKIQPGPLVELDAPPAVSKEEKPFRKFLNITPRPQCVIFPSMQTFAWRERRIVDVGCSIELSDQRDIDLILKLTDLFEEVPDDQPTRDYRSSRMSL